MRYFLLSLFIFSALPLNATEFKLKNYEIKFAKVRVVLNGTPEFYWSLTKGNDRYDDYIAFATNTVTRNYPTPTSDEVNLSSCALRWYSESEFRAAKKGYVTNKIKELKVNFNDEEIADLKGRIDWLKHWRTLNGK